jgi:formylglycine-generating enzyme required for sulfatase activity
MNRVHVQCVIDGAHRILPDCHVLGMEANDDDWGAALSVGRLLLDLGLDDVQHTADGREIVERTQGWLVGMLQVGALNRRERVEAGSVLARLGDTRFVSEAWCLPDEPLLGLVEIPEGPFVMGELDEQHEVALPTYYVARYPTTTEQFKVFVEESGYRPRQPDCLEGPSNHPVTWVSWYEAVDYCKWLGEKLSSIAESKLATDSREGEYRRFWEGLRDGKLVVTLPSEAEWEKAARGPGGRRYPWGREKPDLDRANYGAHFGEPALGTTSTVGCFPRGATPEGVQDMAGNVWELTRTLMGSNLLDGADGWVRSFVPRWWTRSLRGKPWLGPEYGYPYVPGDGREDLAAGENVDRAARGGSWTVDARRLRCAFRDGLPPTSRHSADGFRVSVSPA